MSSDPSATGQLVGRLTAAFLLDTVESGRFDRHFLDALLITAIIQANVAPVVRDPGMQRAYGVYDEPPPDELRQARAVSVNAIATSLRLPYETARRRVAQMARGGLCVITPEGVYVPNAVLTLPSHMTHALESYEQIRVFYVRLRRLGLAPPPSGAPFEGPPPLRAVLRLLGDYFLRSVEGLTRNVRDPVRAIMLLAILHANTEHLPPTWRGAGGETDDAIPDALRRPVAAMTLAAQLRLPRETVRRHVERLVADRQCVRTRRGLVMTSKILARPFWKQFASENVGHLNRMFAGLAELGVLTAWAANSASEDNLEISVG
ncbi:MAG: hypothetical protein ABW360_06350 [Phenylobacterium sp.]